MSAIKKWLDDKLYPDCASNWDDALFRERILSSLRPEHVVLDVGAGAGIVPQMNFKGKVARICGVDLDPRVVDNPMLDEGRVCDASVIPYPNAKFDVVFADNVLEHLAEPAMVFGEVARVLKPGGVFLFKTPNKWHYVPTIARATPHSFHEWINRWRGREAADIFPTLYRANSASAVCRLSCETGFDVVSLERIERRPEYMRISTPTYLVGALYERVVNSTSLLEPFRVLLVGKLRKRAE
jgi:SAM-dependent methyltransferase